jgi:PAS domain-containing protein
LARSRHRGADGRPVPGGDVASDRVIQELTLRRREAEETRRTAEAALARLAESEERFRMLAERTSDVIIRYDPSGMIEYASPAARAWGYAPRNQTGVSNRGGA